MKNKEYAKYGVKRFFLYMIIGIIVSFIPMSYMGALFAFCSVFIAAVLLSVADALRLKMIEESGKNPHEVFSKHATMVILTAALISGCYNYLFFSLGNSSNISIFSLVAIAVISAVILMVIFPIFIYFWTRKEK